MNWDLLINAVIAAAWVFLLQFTKNLAFVFVAWVSITALIASSYLLGYIDAAKEQT